VWCRWFALYITICTIFLLQRNNTDDGVYTIFTGEKDIQNLGIIDKYNGSRYVILKKKIHWPNIEGLVMSVKYSRGNDP
jgi:hypothetical protein